jgi:hypothetical protein
MNNQTQKPYPPFAFFYETECVCLCVCGYDPQNSRYDDNTPYNIGDPFHPHPVSNGVDIDNLRPRNETEVRTTRSCVSSWPSIEEWRDFDAVH